jgi:membrane protein
MQTAPVRLRKRALVAKFFADRGTHLAAMIAYFALLSFVPLVFLSLALLGLAHRADASDFLVKELGRAFPTTSLKSILTLVHRVQDNATTLGIIGGVALLWSSLSLFSALESAFNIVYGKPNRAFLKGKAIAATVMTSTITTLFISLVIGALGVEVVKRYAPGFAANSVTGYVLSITVSLLGVFLFVLAAYRLLTNAEVTVRDVLPGAVMAAIVLEASFQVVPIFVRLAGVSPTLRVLGGPVILLIWLYVMANVIIFGAELNWWQSERRTIRDGTGQPHAVPAPSARDASSVPSTRRRARRPFASRRRG